MLAKEIGNQKVELWLGYFHCEMKLEKVVRKSMESEMYSAHIKILNSFMMSVYLYVCVSHDMWPLECSKYRISFWYICTDFISHKLKGRQCAVKRWLCRMFQFISFRLLNYD